MMPEVFFTADTHFFHANIIKYCGRPFSDTREMNEVIISRWNKTVHPEDSVYHLGDFALGRLPDAQRIFKGLNGIKTLILGNHDRSRKQMLTMDWKLVAQRLRLGKYLLIHRPDRAPERVRVLCGHVHEKWRKRGRFLNVGVDVWGFRPVSLSEVEGAYLA